MDDVLVCMGGGGLLSGVVLVLVYMMFDIVFYILEFVDFDDYKRFLEVGILFFNL